MKVNIGPYPDDGTERVVDIQIDKYDTWSMDNTLALIILPMLQQLKETKHGSPHVDDWDVPENIRSINAAPKENTWDTDEHWHKRWDYVLDEMIFAFGEIVAGEWEDKFYTYDKEFDGTEDWETLRGHIHMDKEGYAAHDARIRNGTRLFGVYYSGLWD